MPAKMKRNYFQFLLQDNRVFGIMLLEGCKNLLLKSLEDTARYAGLLLAPAEAFGLRPRAVFALRAKIKLIMLFWPFSVNFWCPVVTLVTFSSGLSNFERNCKKTNKSKKIQKN